MCWGKGCTELVGAANKKKRERENKIKNKLPMADNNQNTKGGKDINRCKVKRPSHRKIGLFK